ncbi:glycine--tRNA ligase subunit beta [Aminirod propionatiphilus]|uniref:Glycine--tRNA ligase subunit beta n=1 Tax=Aminirod propionatiphilus TaxID=3415223 RepID=A0ACD1DSG6_9BACT|nr:glycine--tRNA ligase subunit beta [Synergistota bacterium]
MNREDLILELGTEEIPAGFMQWVLGEIRAVAEKSFAVARLSYGSLQAQGTPRRIVLSVKGLSDRQEDLMEEYRGPAWKSAFDGTGAPTRAAIGFAKSRGVDVDDLILRQVDGVEYAFAQVKETGRPAESVLPGLLSDIVGAIVFPKNMYWDDPAFRFARPLRWILALWGDRVVPLSLGSLQSGRITRGHRFMGARRIEIAHTSQYLDSLYDNYVVVDVAKRREMIICRIAALEKEMGCKVDLDPDLVEENLFLVEYPVPFFGTFDKDYLDIPSEVLVTSMKVHQRYFPVRDGSGRLKNHFVGVSNNRATNMDVVRDGNERVLRARLADAAFFWKEDQKAPLASRVEELKSIVYQEQIGTVYEKVLRARDLALWLTDHLERRDDRPFVERAAWLAKADLVTHMVYEFPELQGVMGREYARKNGEPDRVAKALYELYLPRFAGDNLPTDPVGALVGLADRADTILACSKVGLDPTGSQDPYGLRRAARCINEILWGLDLDVDIEALMTEAARQMSAGPEVLEKVFDFLRNRLQIQLKEKGYGHDIVALALAASWNRPLQAQRFLLALVDIQGEAWFRQLITAAVRVRNILAKAETCPGTVDPSLFADDAEKALLDALEDLAPQARAARDESRWKDLTAVLAKMEPVLVLFFEKVLVNDENQAVRANRLAILARCQELFHMVGDLGMLK